MIETRHLRVFQVLAEELHFGRTAARLRIAQPAVSQTIKALESEVGAVLFARTRREVRLSRAGEAFLAHAREATTALERARTAARDADSGIAGRLAIRCVLSSSLTTFPQLVARFRRAHPAATIELSPASTLDQLAALRTGSCDLGIVPRQRDFAPLALRVFSHDRLCVAVPSDHAFARRKSVALALLAERDLVFLRETSEPQTHRFFRARCREAGFDPRIVFQSDQIEMLLCAVAAGIGIACLSGAVGRLRFPGVSLVPLTPQITTTLCVLWNPARLSPLAARFLEMVRPAGGA